MLTLDILDAHVTFAGVHSCKILPTTGDLRLRLRRDKSFVVAGLAVRPYFLNRTRDSTIGLYTIFASPFPWQDVSQSLPSDRVPVRHVLVHSRSYLGGRYGQRGGYDITLAAAYRDRPFLQGGADRGTRLYLPCEKMTLLTKSFDCLTYVYTVLPRVRQKLTRVSLSSRFSRGRLGSGSWLWHLQAGSLRGRCQGVRRLVTAAR